jgi:hypothetical protein
MREPRVREGCLASAWSTSSIPKASAFQRILNGLVYRPESPNRRSTRRPCPEQARGLEAAVLKIREDRLFYPGSVFKAEHLDGFVAFINPVINQVVLVNQF